MSAVTKAFLRILHEVAQEIAIPILTFYGRRHLFPTGHLTEAKLLEYTVKTWGSPHRRTGLADIEPVSLYARMPRLQCI